MFSTRLRGSYCSPRVRGWTVFRSLRRPIGRLFPAGAGMDRIEGTFEGFSGPVPRGCGDGPPAEIAAEVPRLCSPRVRGWTADNRRRDPSGRLFPAGAGMDRSPCPAIAGMRAVPRGCGDGPMTAEHQLQRCICSSRVRGWTDGMRTGAPAGQLFPAGSGMDQAPRRRRRCRRPVPREGARRDLRSWCRSLCRATAPRRTYHLFPAGSEMVRWCDPAVGDSYFDSHASARRGRIRPLRT